MNILFIKTGAIGDLIQSAAAINLLDDINLTWCVSAEHSKLLRQIGVARNIIPINMVNLISKNILKNFFYLIFTICLIRIKSSKIDLIVIGHSDWKYRILICLFPFTKKRYYDSKRKLPLQYRNRVHEYWALFCGRDDFRIDIAEAMRKIGRKILSNKSSVECKVNLINNSIVLVPGGSRNLMREDSLRRWPIENYVELANNLIELGYTVSIIGSDSDKWISEHFRNSNVINLVGKLELFDLIHFFDNSRLVISHDTGPLHLASITSSKIFALFGPTPANAVIPIGNSNIRYLEPGNLVSCSPCYDGKNYANCARPFCMESISCSKVLQEILKFI